jgi:hypothetical protein
MLDKTEVVNIKTDKFDIKICRKRDNTIPEPPLEGCFGNPFFLKDINNEKERAIVVEKYRNYFYSRIEKDIEFKKAVLNLRGKKLGCFCKQKDKFVQCHGDIIVEWLENN